MDSRTYGQAYAVKLCKFRGSININYIEPEHEKGEKK